MSTSEAPLSLDLPKRYEKLHARAQAAKVNVKDIVEKVEDATDRVETLLRQVQTGGLGRLEFFLGESGSGKTTFLETLPKFFSGADVTRIPKEIPLLGKIEWIKKRRDENVSPEIYYLDGLDNPQTRLGPGESSRFFDDLREFFREPAGDIVLIWPITFTDKAIELSKEARVIGSDSLIDITTGGVFRFSGLPKSKYYEVADITARSLSGGQSLQAFGITSEVADPLLKNASTISGFYAQVEAKSNEINDYYRDILKEKALPRVWILLAGDQNQAVDLTIGKLTQGTQKQIDIDLLCEYLDNPELDANYTKTWQRLRGRMPHLMRLLDVRVMELPPNVALASARAFGSDDLKSKLKLTQENASPAIKALENTAVYRTAVGETAPNTLLKKTTEKTAQEYLRLQRGANTDDKPLNKAMGELFKAAIDARGIKLTVVTEKQEQKTLFGLQPDILLLGLEDGRPICLETTWRSTGAGIPGELKPQQNTLTPGHMRVYVLQKILTYVEALGLDK